MFVAINISTNLPALEEHSQQKIETCFIILILEKKKDLSSLYSLLTPALCSIISWKICLSSVSLIPLLPFHEQASAPLPVPPLTLFSVRVVPRDLSAAKSGNQFSVLTLLAWPSTCDSWPLPFSQNTLPLGFLGYLWLPESLLHFSFSSTLPS